MQNKLLINIYKHDEVAENYLRKIIADLGQNVIINFSGGRTHSV